MLRKSLFESAIRAGLHKQASQISVSGSGAFAISGSVVHHEPSILGNLGMKLGLVRTYEAGRQSTFTNFNKGILPIPGSFNRRNSMYEAPPVETNADIVHIKLMRNNAFATLTDSKGNRRTGVTAGKLAGRGGKLGRYAGEAAAEEIGRRVKQLKIKSVVVKVNGFTFFRRKKDSILSFKDGYTNSRGDMNPVVYIEDTTRKPHNGCRRRKQRLI